MAKSEPAVYVMCGTYNRAELVNLKIKQEEAGWDTSKIFTAKDGRLSFYYSKDVEFT